MKNDIDSGTDKTVINQKERDSCPECGSIRIIKKGEEYICCKCKWKGKNPQKVMWYFGISYKGGGPPVGRIINPTVRERHFCPDCNSVRIRRRINTQDYFCDGCGWIGNNPKKMKWGAEDIKVIR